jgi:hypothetical protein
MNKLSKRQIEQIKKDLCARVDEVYNINKDSNAGVNFYKPILFLMDKMADGGYYGTISIKIQGNIVHDPKELEVTHKLDGEYILDV